MYSDSQGDRLAGGVFIIGLAFLFFTGNWWPGILFVIGASNLVRALAEGHSWSSVQGALWMIGLGVVFMSGFSLPLLLLLIGISMLFGTRFRPSFMQRWGQTDDETGGFYDFEEIDEKPKRKLKEADGLLFYEEELDSEEPEELSRLLDDEQAGNQPPDQPL